MVTDCTTSKLTPPTAAGTYTFSYALTVDGAQTQFTQARGR
jgi:hypothetical protein